MDYGSSLRKRLPNWVRPVSESIKSSGGRPGPVSPENILAHPENGKNWQPIMVSKQKEAFLKGPYSRFPHRCDSNRERRGVSGRRYLVSLSGMVKTPRLPAKALAGGRSKFSNAARPRTTWAGKQSGLSFRQIRRRRIKVGIQERWG